MELRNSLLKQLPLRSTKDLQDICADLLRLIGESPERKGLMETPKRFAKALAFLTSGYQLSSHDLVGDAIFEEEGAGDLVLVRDIEFYSLCEHHLLPFFGKAHVAYIPDGKVIGLSKIPRVVDMFARRLQVQERLTHQIGTEINSVLQPKGVGVIIEASHLCMMMRGVEKQKSKTVTKYMAGAFTTDPNLRRDLMSVLTP